MAIKLKTARVDAGKSQKEAARETGKTPATIRSYEAYKSKPDIETAYKLAKFYGVGIDDIIWSE